MKSSFLSYYKTILEKVSFDTNLILKEYNKALGTLESNEVEEFNKWLKSRDYYKEIIPEQLKA